MNLVVPVLANAGTPLMWFTMLHLLFGNLIIGLLEGTLLSMMMKARLGRSIMLVIPANYLSAFAGALALHWIFTPQPDIHLENIGRWLLIMTSTAFLITLIIEFPFFWFATRTLKPRFLKLAGVIVLIHIISYGGLVLVFWWVSPTSLVTKLAVVPPQQLMAKASGCSLYHITRDGGTILRTDFSTGKTVEVLKVDARDKNDRLFARDDEGAARHDLYLLSGESEKCVLPDFAPSAAVIRDPSGTQLDKQDNTWSTFNRTASLAGHSDWRFNAGFWDAEGITGINQKENKKVRYALETPFVSWSVRNVTQLPGDLLVFQLSDEQICLLDPHAKLISLIARGKGPVVAATKATP